MGEISDDIFFNYIGEGKNLITTVPYRRKKK